MIQPTLRVCTDTMSRSARTSSHRCPSASSPATAATTPPRRPPRASEPTGTAVRTSPSMYRQPRPSTAAEIAVLLISPVTGRPYARRGPTSASNRSRSVASARHRRTGRRGANAAPGARAPVRRARPPRRAAPPCTRSSRKIHGDAERARDVPRVHHVVEQVEPDRPAAAERHLGAELRQREPRVEHAPVGERRDHLLGGRRVRRDRVAPERARPATPAGRRRRRGPPRRTRGAARSCARAGRRVSTPHTVWAGRRSAAPTSATTSTLARTARASTPTSIICIRIPSTQRIRSVNGRIV